MNDTVKLVIAVVCLLGPLVMRYVEPKPAPAPQPRPAAVLDLSSAFASAADQATRRTHADDARRIFEITADGVEWDGTQPEGERKFTSDQHVDEHVVTVRKFFAHQWRFGDAYPSLGTAVAAHLKERLGKDFDKPLDASRRRQWVEALREVSAACADVVGG